MILVVAVVLWIVWVGPYVLRTHRHEFQPAGDYFAEASPHEMPDPRAGVVMKLATRQEKVMDARHGTKGSAGTINSRQSKTFKIRYGRTALALVGLVSLLSGLVSVVLLAFGMTEPVVPLACAVLTAVVVAVLRSLAIRDRKGKVDAAFRSAMHQPAPRAADAPLRTEPKVLPVRPEKPLFDAEADRPQAKPLTAVELREAALAVAEAAGDSMVNAAVPVATWEPVEIPKPVYVDAAKAERPAPEPLALPEAPKASGKPSLKQGAAAVASGPAPDAEHPSKAPSSLSNLDDVLQRRRA